MYPRYKESIFCCLYSGVSHCCSPNAIIATNTLRLDGTNIVDRAAYKEVGLATVRMHE